MSTPKRLGLVAALAAGFVIFRLLYAFVFSGLAGDRVVLELGRIQLAGPFRHISLFGPVSVDGIIRNVELALPFASAVLLFGLLSLVITPERVLRLSRRLGGNQLVTALGVGLAAVPELLQAAARQLKIRRLRGETRLSVMVPLLEKATARAGEVALELARSRPERQRPATLKVQGLTAFPLRSVSFNLEPGSILVLSGETGSGKSTLLAALGGELAEHQGRIQEGTVRLGEVDLADFGSASKLSYLVHQLPRPLGYSGSHGESYQKLVSEALDRQPALLMLDEPAGVLDEQKLANLKRELTEFASNGGIVVIAEHRLSALADLDAVHMHINNGELKEGPFTPAKQEPLRRPMLVGRERSVEISGEVVRNSERLIEHFQLELNQGECVAVVGPNGSGKTSLLESVAHGLFDLRVNGVSSSGPHQAAIVPDEPGEFFVTEALAKELARADRVAKVSAGFTKTSFESILGLRDQLVETHPLDLSAGTQLALATAMQLSFKPSLVLLDEPVRGLDPGSRALMAETIRCVQETGCAVLLTTHDLQFATVIADRVYEISGRELHQRVEVAS